MNSSYWPFVVRPLIALLTAGFFQPDEYYQALEPAHNTVFGYGHLTWEWKIAPPIRSISYPGIWIPLYWILKTSGLDTGPLLVYGPRLIAGIIAAFADLFAAKLATKVFGKEVGAVTMLLSLTSPFHALALSRTLSNSLETVLAIVGLYYWPFGTASDEDVRNAILSAALAFFFRPTSAVFWLYPAAHLLLRVIRRKAPRSYLTTAVVYGGRIVAGMVLLDYRYYGKLTFVPLSFFRANLLVSAFYGGNPWHYYLTQALPILCATTLPFALHGAWTARRLPDQAGTTSHALVATAITTIVIYSLGRHKEWRFIHPVLPVLHIFAAKSLVDLYQRTSAARTFQRPLAVRWPHLALILVTLPAIPYIVLQHGRAQVDVMHYLRSAPDLKSVGFLMPCHSTPWQAYLHRPEVEMWMIGCEPPLVGGGNISLYKDQTRVFYDNPQAYIDNFFPHFVDPWFPRSPLPMSPPGDSSVTAWYHSWPSHLVFFGALLQDYPSIRKTLEEKGYSQVWYGENGWEEDQRRKGGVTVWRSSHVDFDPPKASL